uniref:COP9 signalosome complex subunit 6 n=1 Tax=Setaria digitata TaxID=48799 RepID=A0A915PSA6_9BILA
MYPFQGHNDVVMMDLSMSEDDNKSVGHSELISAITVSLHPLVIMNISEHVTRISAQHTDGKPFEVFGAILGKQSGRHVEMMNSFEVKWSDEGKGYAIIDANFLSTREQQCKIFFFSDVYVHEAYNTKLYQILFNISREDRMCIRLDQEVFHDLDYVGWYTVGGTTPTQADWQVHQQFSVMHESPILVKLDPKAPPGNKLPVAIYESVSTTGVSTSGSASVVWHPVSWSLASEQAERIGIEHVAQISTVSANSISSTNKQIVGQLGAINMLQSRLELIYDYLMAVRKGELPRDEVVIREIAQLVRRVPVMSSEKFLEQYKNQCLEVKMTALVAALTKTCGTLNDLVTKMNVMSMERQTWLLASGRRARPFPAV